MSSFTHQEWELAQNGIQDQILSEFHVASRYTLHYWQRIQEEVLVLISFVICLFVSLAWFFRKGTLIEPPIAIPGNILINAFPGRTLGDGLFEVC